MSTGEVYGCSDKIGLEDFKYGNIKDTAFTKIWFEDKRMRAISYMSGYHTIACRPGCRMDKCNRYLEELDSPGSHVNFI